MNESIDIMRGGRKFLINILEGISIEKLNEVPAGFNNNLAWNMAHIIANQQILCYRNAGEKPVLDDDFIDKYKTGTRPEGFIDEEEFKDLQKKLTASIDQFEKDWEKKKFKNYEAREIKSYPGVKIENIKDGLNLPLFMMGCTSDIRWL